MSRRAHDEVLIDLVSDDDDNECKSKRSRTNKRTTVNTSSSSKNALPSFYDNLPKNRISRNSTGGRSNADKHKLDTSVFQLYMEDLWKCIDEDKKSAYAYFDSLWFNMYYYGHNESNVLKWIKAKRIFSREFVFIPIICSSGHWSLLVLCHFDDTNCSDTKKGPRMIVLDSLHAADPTQLQPSIRRFIADIYKTEEREETRRFINKIRLEYPKVPQQNNGDECGIYVLFFIKSILQNKKLMEVLQNKKLEEDFTQLFEDGCFNPEELETFRKDIHSFQANQNKTVDGGMAPTL
ncbi:hypothetical protein ACP4OV_015197 [Aristida adscensionis]